MFLEFYGLTEQPFGVTPDPRFLYMGPAQQEALSSLAYGIEMGRGFMALIASPGLGKTTLLLQLMERLRGSARTAFLFQTQTTPHELLRSLLTDLEIEPASQDLGDMQRQLGDVLIRETQAGRRIVVAIDEAQNFSDELLETVRTLSNFETPREKLLQIVLVGQPQLADKLATPHLEQLRQRISIITQFPPLKSDDVPKYIDHRLRVAGYQGTGLFTPTALGLIVTHSRGIPRNINNLCFQALSLGYAKNQAKVDQATLAEVIADLSLESMRTDSQVPQPLLTTKQRGPTPDTPKKPEGREKPAPSPAVIASLPVAKAGNHLLDRVDLGSASAMGYGSSVPVNGRAVPGRVAGARRAQTAHWSRWLFAAAVVIGFFWAGPKLMPGLKQFAAGGRFNWNSGQATASMAPTAATSPSTLAAPKATPSVLTSPQAAGKPTLAVPAVTVGNPPATRAHNEFAHNTLPVDADGYAPGSGRLVVESSIAGGQIALNGRTDPKWVTPRLFSLPSGTYVVTVLKGGYVAWTQHVHVDEGREEFLMAKMESTEGGIFTVETEPPGMQVYIDGKAYGLSRVETVLKAGWHVCQVFPKPGLQPLTSTFQLRPGETVTRRIRMKSPASSSRDDPRLSGNASANLTAGAEGGLP